MASRRRRATVLVALLALVLVALAHPGAGAEYQGSSLYDNVAPESQVDGSLADRYPLNRYGLDYHVNVGVEDEDIPVVPDIPSGVDLDGVPALIMHALAGMLWDFTRFLLNAVIALFTFAFSLDLVAGSSQTGGQGALTPIADATRDLYDELGEWLAVAIAALGGWMAWQVFVRREIVATFGQVAVSVAMVLAAMLLITQPQWTVGGASKLSNEASLALLGALNEGDTSSAKTQASNQLFQTLIYDPWVVLNFGGIEHCVDGDDRPVKPKSRDCRTLIDHKKKYAERWLRAGAPNSKDRTDEYNAIREGKTPSSDPASGYELSDADKPAVDIQQQAMGGERLGYAVLIFLGSLGAVVLLGALSIGVIFAQVLALLLFAFAPLVLLAAVFPGAGHATFRTWFERLFFALGRKLVYAAILAVLLAISSALLDASANLGWLMAFGLQCTFYWAVFLYRKEIYNALIRAWPGSTGAGQERRGDLGARARSAYYTSKMLSPAVQATGGAATMGLRLGAGAAAGGGRAAREGARTAGALADGYATRGHSTRMAGAATTAAAAMSELEDEHRGNRGQFRQERSRRSRIEALESQERRESALPEREAGELARLRKGRMDDDAYDRLGARVAEVDRRRREGEPSFTETEVQAKAREIAARDAVAAGNGKGRDTTRDDGALAPQADSDRARPQADYERRIDVRGSGGRDPEYEALKRDNQYQEERLRKLDEEWDQIFPNGTEPPPRRSSRRGPFRLRRRRTKGGGQ